MSSNHLIIAIGLIVAVDVLVRLFRRNKKPMVYPTMTYREVADTLEAFVDRRGGKWDWDNYMSATSFADPYLQHVQERMIHLDDEFPAERGKGFCNLEGMQVIRDYVRELRERAIQGGNSDDRPIE